MNAQSISHVESLEPRRMQSTTLSTWNASVISDPQGWDVFAEVRFGDNGSFWGVGEAATGTVEGEDDAGIVAWDSNLSDGLDSGWVQVELTVTTGADGTVAWNVGHASASDSTPSSLDVIKKVTIRADVEASGMAMSWGTVDVKFFQNGNLVDEASANPSANTIGSSSGNSAESGAAITTSYSNCDQVVISGSVRLQAVQGVHVDETAIFGQILISSQA